MKGLNFKNLIGIWDLVETTNEYGDIIKDWKETTKAWADIKTMKGREYYAAATVQKVDNIRFIIRYIPEVHHYSRIMFNGQAYKIESITNDDAQNRTITIICEMIPKIND